MKTGPARSIRARSICRGSSVWYIAFRDGMKNIAPQREVLEAAMKFHAVVMKNAPKEPANGDH